MKASTKWLIGFGAAIGALVVTAIIMVAVMTGPGADSLPPEDTPEGVVLRYFQALNEEDYETAYSYLSPEALADSEQYDSFDTWLDLNKYSYSYRNEFVWKATVGDVNITGDKASVEIVITTMETSSPLNTYRYSNSEWYQLDELAVGWRITSPLDIPWSIR